MDWMKQRWQILGIFHSILNHIQYYGTVTVIKIKYRVNFLVAILYDITTWRTVEIFISATLGVHTPKHNRMRHNKQAQQFQILITYSNANGPTIQFSNKHKISCLNSFGTYNFCTTLWHSFTVSTATNGRHDRFLTFHSEIQPL